MPKNDDKYLVDGVDMAALRNRNEAKVVECMREELATMLDGDFTEKDLMDVYAFSLNQLPARYAQRGTIILRESVQKEVVRAVVRDAFELVIKHPKD